MKGGGGADIHPSMSKPPDARRLTWDQGRKRDGYGYIEFDSRSRSRQHRPVPPLPGLPVPKEGLWHRGPITPPNRTIGIQRGTLSVWTLGELMGLPESGANT